MKVRMFNMWTHVDCFWWMCLGPNYVKRKRNVGEGQNCLQNERDTVASTKHNDILNSFIRPLVVECGSYLYQLTSNMWRISNKFLIYCSIDISPLASFQQNMLNILFNIAIYEYKILLLHWRQNKELSGDLNTDEALMLTRYRVGWVRQRIKTWILLPLVDCKR